MDKETVFLVWLGALVAPPILFGVWMRLKLASSEEGEEFLIQREVEKINYEKKTRRIGLSDDKRDGRVARAVHDHEALEGKYGDDVSALLKKSIPFIIGYGVWVALLMIIGVIWIF